MANNSDPGKPDRPQDQHPAPHGHGKRDTAEEEAAFDELMKAADSGHKKASDSGHGKAAPPPQGDAAAEDAAFAKMMDALSIEDTGGPPPAPPTTGTESGSAVDLGRHGQEPRSTPVTPAGESSFP